MLLVVNIIITKLRKCKIKDTHIAFFDFIAILKQLTICKYEREATKYSA
jgi:hypothetical protein